MKTGEHYCSCEEWQHTGKPCQHALALITSQQIRDVHLEDYVDEHYSVAYFWNAYSSIIEPLPDKSLWPKVDLPFVVCAPLKKRDPGRYRKLRIKGCLEGGGSKSSAKSAKNDKERQVIRRKRKCKGCGELGHGETSYKCKLNGIKKKRQGCSIKLLFSAYIFFIFFHNSLYF